MTRQLTIDPRLFDEAAIPDEARRLNDEIRQKIAAAPDLWSVPMEKVRAARAAGKGTFPLCDPDPHAADMQIGGPDGALRLRVMRPQSRPETGTYLHLHGGGWVMGSPEENDSRLRRLCENTGLATISVDYRLAPEHPYPAGPDDCEAAALWLLSDNTDGYNRDFLAIGGESAGAHLAAVILLRLRDRHGLTPFSAAILTAGCYDVGMTASVRNWGTDKLVLNTRDVTNFCERYMAGGGDLRDPDVSPIYAELDRMPQALFTCGTKDLLIDDTLMMATRWCTAGSPVELAIYPGGCHVFQGFDCPQGEQSLGEMDAFINRMIAKRPGA